MAEQINLSPYPVEKAERLAKVVGKNSAVAHALTELKRRQDAGEDVGLFVYRSHIVVGPRLPPAHEQKEAD